MSLSPRKIGSIVLVLVLLALVTPAAHALPTSGGLKAFRSGDALTAVWEWLGSLFIPNHETPAPRGDWRKAGSQMDPNGCPRQNDFVSGGSLDAGSQMDPNGDK